MSKFAAHVKMFRLIFRVKFHQLLKDLKVVIHLDRGLVFFIKLCQSLPSYRLVRARIGSPFISLYRVKLLKFLSLYVENLT